MFIYTLILLLANRSSGIPLTARSVGNDTNPQNGTSIPTPSWWVPGCSGRGTYALISSCLLTLVICAWTAYHPNIPATTSLWALAGRRMRWIVVAVFTPELVIVVACSQLHAAWRLKKEVNSTASLLKAGKKENMGRIFSQTCEIGCSKNLVDESNPSKPLHESRTWPVTKKNQQSDVRVGIPVSDQSVDDFHHRDTAPKRWSFSQAFFALSGGIAVETGSFYPVKRLTFEPKAIVILARLGILPEIGLEDVNDRSKADSFAKSLVCVQVGWFFIQTIARLQQGLPLTLLEIHTNTHIICAFFMYAIWAAKPYDVGVPIISTDERVVDMAAFFASNSFERVSEDGGRITARHCTSSSSITRDNIKSAHEKPVRRNESSMWWVDTIKDACCCLVRKRSRPPKIDSNQVAEHLRRANRAIAFMRDQGYHINWLERESYICADNDGEDDEYDVARTIRSITFSDPMIAAEACTLPESSLKSADMLASRALSSSQPDSTGRPDAKPSEKDADKRKSRSLGVRIFQESFSITEKSNLRRWVLIIFSGIYGGAHLSAWNSHFPTTVEMWMWRSSGICLAAGPFIAGVTAFVEGVWMKVDAARDEARTKNEDLFWWSTLKWLVTMPFFFLFMLCEVGMVLYGAARLYILVEAFASLRSPAAGTYKTVDWVSYIPHAS